MEKKASPRALAGQLGHPKYTTEEVFGKKSSTDRNGRLPAKRESGSLQASASLLARRIAGSLIACVSL